MTVVDLKGLYIYTSYHCQNRPVQNHTKFCQNRPIEAHKICQNRPIICCNRPANSQCKHSVTRDHTSKRLVDCLRIYIVNAAIDPQVRTAEVAVASFLNLPNRDESNRLSNRPNNRPNNGPNTHEQRITTNARKNTRENRTAEQAIVQSNLIRGTPRASSSDSMVLTAIFATRPKPIGIERYLLPGTSSVNQREVKLELVAL